MTFRQLQQILRSAADEQGRDGPSRAATHASASAGDGRIADGLSGIRTFGATSYLVAEGSRIGELEGDSVHGAGPDHVASLLLKRLDDGVEIVGEAKGRDPGLDDVSA
jgi:hypothetical protein